MAKIISSVVMATLVVSACSPGASTPQAQMSTVSSVEQDASSSIAGVAAWEIYTDETYGFSLRHPPQTLVVEDREGYIRLRNYMPDYSVRGLGLNQYYVEIHIPDEPRADGFAACKESVVEGQEVQVSGLTGYRGLGEDGGDPGGKRFALCLEGSGKYFFVMATENHEEGPIANAILDSFTLIR